MANELLRMSPSISNRMGQRKKQIDQCLNDIQKYEKWGNLLAGQSWGHLFKSI
jgi:hypothetical protein